MIVQRIRWQALMALLGIALVLAMLFSLSRTVRSMVVAQPGGTYIEGVASRPVNLNPLYAQSRADRDLTGLLFNQLLDADERGEFQPDLARDWSVSDDGRTYTFELRDDVTWHDGEPFTAEDVAFTIRVIQDEAYDANPALSEIWRSVEAVEVVDEQTLTVTLPAALAPFAPFLGFATFSILPSHLLGELPVSALATAPFSVAPIGTGPWRLQRVESDRVALVPHGGAFEGHTPALDRVELRFYESTAELFEAYDRGEIMGIGQLPPTMVDEVLARPSLVPYVAPFSGYTALFLNLRVPALQDRAVREALLLSIDRQGLIDETLGGNGIVADGFLMPSHWAYNPELIRTPYDLASAAERLDGAGWLDSGDEGAREKEGQPLSLRLLVSRSNSTQLAVAEAVIAAWERVGVRGTLNDVADDAAFQQALIARDFDVVLLSTPPQGLPADPDFYPIWHSSQAVAPGENVTGFSSERADQILVEARRTLDVASRKGYYDEFQLLLSSELPALPLYHPIYIYAVSDLIRDVQVGPMTTVSDRFVSLNDWYMRTRRLLVAEGQPTPTPAIESYREDR